MKYAWTALLVLVMGAAACRSPDPGSESARGNLREPGGRQEAAELERKGRSFEVANPPAWVNNPRPPSGRPLEWVQVGRTKYRLGGAPQLPRDGDLLALLQKPAPHEGKVVRVRARLHRCGDLHLMRPAGRAEAPELVLMVNLPQKDLGTIPGESVVEGKLTVKPIQLNNARSSCGAAHHSPALLVADTVIASRRP